MDSDEQRIDVDSSPVEERSWRGVPMDVIYRGLDRYELRHVPEVRPSEDHAVLYNFPVDPCAAEPPKPRRSYNKWDANHVRLPCSHRSQYPVEQDDGTSTLESRWELVQNALLQPITNSRQLEKAILCYNTKYENIWKFKSLHKLFEEELDEDESVRFFKCTLPKMIQIALALPELVNGAIPLLKQGCNASISLSQQQAASLLANAFFCTFPRRNTQKKRSEYSLFPDINFNRLFQSTGQSVIEKIKCICNYFRRVCARMPTGVLTFQRRYINPKQFIDWNNCDAVVARETVPVHITSEGTIEDQGKGLLQVDFANKYLGGGVLGHGCVQEEIRFVINPELLVGKLFTEALKPQEALVMMGSEQYSEYSGYASNFTFAGDFHDETPRDASGRRECYIVAIDALHFVQSSHQYREELLLRELNKAYVGYFHPLSTAAPGVATGNWGCGAFGGDATLKAVLQLMVCCVLHRPMVYYTFGDRELRDQIYAMYAFLVDNKVKVREIWRTLRDFRKHSLPASKLYSYFYQDFYDRKNKISCFDMKSCTKTKEKSPEPKTAHKSPPNRDQIDDENLANLMKDLVDDDDIQSNQSSSSALENADSVRHSFSMEQKSVVVTPSPKKSGRLSLITELDRNYYSVGPGPAKKLCPSTSPRPPPTAEQNNEDDDATSGADEVRIQIEDDQIDHSLVLKITDERTVEGAIQFEQELGEFVEGTPPKETRRSIGGNAGSKKISDYFFKVGK
ncbi:poly(ADP-ribose) glycohydrolase-like isoform X2 [Malaya genurostris]|uniref:poly(ADP-ribose) glycohydrolase-like isoform X2 n=1 Tax=Malaya genurostris TaxID=325434 RepID=UPI0026F3968A|nr:poly(ADP-ribose) glycohydrolase-like isoform X2 [Malaya genurostris]